MVQMLVRNLNEKTIQALKKGAKAHERSLQSEVKMILEAAAVAYYPEKKVDHETARKMCKKFRERFKGRKFSDSAELIREDRNR